MQTYIILAGIIFFTVVADYALKYASQAMVPLLSTWFIAGACLYAITAVGWLWLMQSHNLAQIGVMYSAATILTLTAVGYIFFGEGVSPRQIAGLGAALISVFLMQS